MLHVLPDGYMRIRHFGFLANRWKKKYLSKCRQLLGLPPQEPETCIKTTLDLMLELTGIDPDVAKVEDAAGPRRQG